MKVDKQVLQRLRDTLEDQCPRGYDAHADRLADEHDHKDAVNALGKALREAIELLETVT